MAVKIITRIAIFSIICIVFGVQAQSGKYKIPDVTIKAFKPKGFRASIPDAPNLSLFVFQGNVNKPIKNNGVGTIAGEIMQATNGKWVYEDPNLQLKVGDVINYYVFASVDRVGYLKDDLSFTVEALEDPSQPEPDKPPKDCQPTVTTVRGGTACAGQIIFEDNFDTLKEDYWQLEQYIPVDHPEYPFVSYQRLTGDPTVSVENGNLRITPKLQQTLPGFTNDSIYCGSLNLFSGCTHSADACFTQASGANIIPPVVSGRISSKAFAFTYGTVNIRAKLPQGDWVYPEILLEPLLKKYGTMNFASGVLKIATARGNRQLNSGQKDYGNKILYGGPIMDFSCRDTLLSSKVMTNGRMWGDDFHEYSLRWAPDRITLSVDGEEWARVEPAAGGIRTRLPTAQCSDVPQMLLAMGTPMAPFDEKFYVTLGVAAGGITEFPDGVHSAGSAPKPWVNRGRKASLHFWEDMDRWYPTWNQPSLLVDYVRIVAL